MSDIAKPYQIYVKQRSRTDVNSPYQQKWLTNSEVPLFLRFKAEISNFSNSLGRIQRAKKASHATVPFRHVIVTGKLQPSVNLTWTKLREREQGESIGKPLLLSQLFNNCLRTYRGLLLLIFLYILYSFERLRLIRDYCMFDTYPTFWSEPRVYPSLQQG